MGAAYCSDKTSVRPSIFNVSLLPPSVKHTLAVDAAVIMRAQ